MQNSHAIAYEKDLIPAVFVLWAIVALFAFALSRLHFLLILVVHVFLFHFRHFSRFTSLSSFTRQLALFCGLLFPSAPKKCAEKLFIAFAHHCSSEIFGNSVVSVSLFHPRLGKSMCSLSGTHN
jgi:hypothetical protein